MRLYNKGSRSFIINRIDAITGCRLPEDIMAKDKAYIDPSTDVEISDSVGKKLLQDYPEELKEMGSSGVVNSGRITGRRKVKKEKKETKLKR